jgi:VWFA-related protein
VAALALLAPTLGVSQAPAEGAPPTIIRAETRLVLVDAVVRDKKGKLATDLGAKDFRLWEDGKERPITSVTAGAGASGADMQYVVFLFDSLGLRAQRGIPEEKALRQDVSDFAGAFASPLRYMAVVNYTGDLLVAQNFTTMSERVQRAAFSLPPLSDTDETSAAPPADFQSVISDASGGHYLTDWQLKTTMNNTSAAAMRADTAPRFPVVNALIRITDSLAAIRGRKTVVILGGLGPAAPGAQPDSEQTEEAVRACNRANIAVYSTSPSLKGLDQETGGRVIAGKLVSELSDAVADQEKRYVLAFTPVESPDGSCHTLRVQTTVSGLELGARNAYCNDPAPDPLAGLLKGKELEARAAAPSAGNTATMELPFFYVSPGTALVDLAMEMDLANLKFAKQNGKQHADVNLVGLVDNPNGDLAARFSDTLHFDFDTAQESEAFRKQPYGYEHQFRVAPGSYAVRLAYGSAEESLGKAEAPLSIAPWDGRTLALSGIALASETSPAPALTADLDASLLSGRKNLVAKSLALWPSGSNRFQASNPCFTYVELYHAAPAAPIQMRILDRRTGEAKFTAQTPAANYILPGNPMTPVILKVPVASLPPGPYTLELSAASSPGEPPVTRTADFSIGN